MKLVELMKKLNDEQREAAEDIYGASMVIAGPGSGNVNTFIIK